MNNEWTWSDSQEAWLYGSRNVGAGVFQQDGQWYGNVINRDTMIVIGPRQTREVVQHIAEDTLRSLTE